MVQLQNEAQIQQFSSSAWIGLYNDVKSWRWSFGNEPLGSMTKWNPGEPGNWGGHEECVATSSSAWFDAPCTLMFPLLCFDDRQTGNGRYIYNSNTMTWLEAQSYCRQHYTDLTSVRNTTEHLAIQGLVTGSAWIGLFRDAWKWVDKTNFSTISWMSGKPDNALGNENCGYVNNGQAADAQCSDVMPFFCYSDAEIIKKQIIRLKIQSNQDVNNLISQAAILEQIRQKLKDHGMAENITVEWRKQPNGVVFHKEKEGD
ncbi:C-type mannose receptor 2-like isoform X1 [Ictalurus punctatus]|uniref:C-type mannose receptor 2-like isoform X1 n=1 Tax=Ictalurus punctatus TaxID=7998 RepID=A0A9F7RF95_ICTPU|nr:C-type mannose receptor 2-like isoform X1 [Ictalurus punctatus]